MVIFGSDSQAAAKTITMGKKAYPLSRIPAFIEINKANVPREKGRNSVRLGDSNPGRATFCSGIEENLSSSVQF